MDINKRDREIMAKEGVAVELGKIKELSKNLSKDIASKKHEITREEGDDIVEKRLEDLKTNKKSEIADGNKADNDKFNKKGEVSFGTSGCEGYCKKVHDGTSVHGTYY